LLLAIDFPAARDNASIPALKFALSTKRLTTATAQEHAKSKPRSKATDKSVRPTRPKSPRATFSVVERLHFANLYGLFTNSLRKTAVGARPIGEGFAGIQLPPPARKK
jgi:hypothetical protein